MKEGLECNENQEEEGRNTANHRTEYHQKAIIWAMRGKKIKKALFQKKTRRGSTGGSEREGFR